MRLARVSPPDGSAWASLLGAAERASVFHTAEWARLWTAEWPGARWEALVIEDGTGYAAALPFISRSRIFGRTIASMPYGTYGGPIVRAGLADAPRVRGELLGAFAGVLGAGMLHRGELSWEAGALAEVPPTLHASEGFTHVRSLTRDYAAVMAEFRPTIRARMRQAEEQGLTLHAATDAADVRAYYAMVLDTLKRRRARPKPLALYQRVLEALVPAGLARFDLAMHGETPIGGSLHLLYRGVAVNWLTVSYHAHLRLRPNHFLISRVIQSLCGSGYREYNLGGSPVDATELIQFKEGWGAEKRAVIEVRREAPWLGWGRR
jgi:CelD/BcsL family acetyltransferase involved in cellulose biosynthesis